VPSISFIPQVVNVAQTALSRCSMLRIDRNAQAYLAVSVDANHSAVMDFATTAGGALYAASFAGSITGRGADLIIIDDPHDIKDAGNPQQLAQTTKLFETVVLSRLNNRKTGKVIVIAHRIHEDDLSGHLLRQGDWSHLVLPMVAVKDADYVTEYGRWRRRKDELLRPDAFDLADLDHMKANTHNPDFEMLYQQDTDGRALPPITADCFPSVPTPFAPDAACVMSIDAGMTRGQRNSFSAIQIWCTFVILSINGVSNATLMNCGIGSFDISVVTARQRFLLRKRRTVLL
jgi:hypothetical protein